MGEYAKYIIPCYLGLLVLIIAHIYAAIKYKSRIERKISKQLQAKLIDD